MCLNDVVTVAGSLAINVLRGVRSMRCRQRIWRTASRLRLLWIDEFFGKSEARRS